MTTTTRDTSFREIPAEHCTLFSVAAGVSTATALQEASDLEDAVRQLLTLCIETGADGSIASLCAFALETANALRRASAQD